MRGRVPRQKEAVERDIVSEVWMCGCVDVWRVSTRACICKEPSPPWSLPPYPVLLLLSTLPHSTFLAAYPPQVRPPTLEEVKLLRPNGAHLITTLQPAQNPDLVDALAAHKATVIALDCMQRTLR